MSDVLPCVEIEPSSAATSAIVWMHGLGANGHDFEDIVPMLGLERTRFVFPHAPARPVTINGGWVMPAWYDILSLDAHAPDRETESDIRSSERDVRALVERERERGIAPERIVLAGFSQGAAMALHVGTRYEHPLAGILCLSGYLVLADQFATERHPANRDTPICFCHGTQDPVLPLSRGRAAYDAVRAGSEAPIDWHTFPIGHSMCPPEVEVVGRWLRDRLPGG